MITSLRLVNFKNFADETLRMGPFTVIVGANASGKSNIRDAFRFLHGIGRGYSLPEIIGGKYGAGSQIEWERLRGAANEIVRFGQSEFSMLVEVTSDYADIENISYFIQIQSDDKDFRGFRVTAESLSGDSNTLYTSSPPLDGNLSAPENEFVRRLYLPPTDDRNVDLRSDEPGLHEVGHRLLRPLNNNSVPWNILGPGAEPIVRCSDKVIGAFRRARLLELSPERMREPSFPGADALGDTGENLPTVLEGICADPQRRDVLTSWLQELTPMDVVDFKFPRDPSGRIYLQILESNGRKVSAYSASDGTLRFLGMLAALLSDDQTRLYFFEEIDNGIHPNRLWLLLDLIEKQTAKSGIQVITTTHSPDVLNLISDETFENASVVHRGEESSDAVIRPMADLPNARKLRKSQGLGRLHASGWMEDMLTVEGWRDADARAGE